ncbi:hypothetical protein TURU_121568 [Turdus rufiventris]|nr:hypothetical protein TURU_121568 [Turdus rufiventris]
MPTVWKFQRDTNHCSVLGPGPGLPSPVQHSSGSSREKDLPGFDDKVTGTAATPTLAPDPEPEHQPCQHQSPLFTRGNGHKRACLVKENKAGPSQEREEEVEQEELLFGSSVPIPERAVGFAKGFSHQRGEQVITRLLRCWVTGLSLELEGRETKQLESPSKEGRIDEAIGKG